MDGPYAKPGPTLPRYAQDRFEENAMSDNPLDTNPEREARIKARAQQMWEEAGSPEGLMDEFTERADELIRMEGAGASGQLPNPMTQNERMPGVLVEEASIQENLGEFPGARVADQGEWRETPMTRDELRKDSDEAPDRGEAP